MGLHARGRKISCKAGRGKTRVRQAGEGITKIEDLAKRTVRAAGDNDATFRYGTETVKIRDIALDGDLPEKFLELILLELSKNAHLVEAFGARRAATGCGSARGDQTQRRSFVWLTAPHWGCGSTPRPHHHRSLHRALYSVFLEVRCRGQIWTTTVADIAGDSSKTRKRPSAKKKAKKGSLLSIVQGARGAEVAIHSGARKAGSFPFDKRKVRMTMSSGSLVLRPVKRERPGTRHMRL